MFKTRTSWAAVGHPARRRTGSSTLAAATGLLLGLAMVPAATASAAEAARTVTGSSIGTLLAALADPGGNAGDGFGSSVAVSGTTAVVGAPATNSSAGAAYVYLKGGSGWPTTPTATLLDPGAAAGDGFGSSVAVSGTTAVVGAPATNSSAGAAYVYLKGGSGWPTTPTATLLDPGAAAGDGFGSSVAVSGTTAVIAASGRSYGGAVYVYQKGGSGWPTTPTATLPSPTSQYRFGTSVAVSGTAAIVGAVHGAFGTAYLYVRGSSGWPTTPTANLAPPKGAHRFGFSVAVSGTTGFVGAPYANDGAYWAGAAYVYLKGASGWPTAPTATLRDPGATRYDEFGSSAAVAGTIAVIGGPYGNSSPGTAYAYVKGTGGWPATPTVALKEPGATAGDEFGAAVAVSGPTAIVGAPRVSSGAGGAYIYQV